MTIKLKTISRVNPLKKEEAPKFYVTAKHDTRVSEEELAQKISKRCTLRESDVRGALIALLDIMQEELILGNIVSLGNIGSFYVNVSSNGTDNSTDLSLKDVRGTKIVYAPSKKLKKQLLLIDYSLPTAS